MISRKYWEKYHEFVLKALDLYSERVALRVVQWVDDDESLLYLSDIVESSPTEDEIVRLLDGLVVSVKMKVRYIGESDLCLTNGELYNVVAIENTLYRIVDDSGEDYFFYPEEFEIIEIQQNPILLN